MKKSDYLILAKAGSVLATVLALVAGLQAFVFKTQDFFAATSDISLILYAISGIIVLFTRFKTLPNNFINKLMRAINFPLAAAVFLFVYNLPIVFNVQGEWFLAILMVMGFTLGALIINLLLYLWYFKINRRGFKVIYYIMYFLITGIIFYASFLVTFIGALATYE